MGYKGVECQSLEKDDDEPLNIEKDKPVCFGDCELLKECKRPCILIFECQTKCKEKGENKI